MAVERTVTYPAESPYGDTSIYRLGLDVMTHKSIPRYPDDTLYTIEIQHNLRPDLLAYKLYGTVKLWWVFSARNPSQLKDPIFDFTTGNQIYIPTKKTLQGALGI